MRDGVKLIMLLHPLQMNAKCVGNIVRNGQSNCNVTVTLKTESMFDNFPLDTQLLCTHWTKSSRLKCIKYYVHFSTFMQNLKGIRPVVMEEMKFKVRVHIDSVLNVVLRTPILHPTIPQPITSATKAVYFGAS